MFIHTLYLYMGGVERVKNGILLSLKVFYFLKSGTLCLIIHFSFAHTLCVNLSSKFAH